jgi:cytoskeletal protein CcmA (bactofilin family)
MASTTDDGVFESRIGTGTKITGKLTFRGRTRIEGDAEGEIRGEEIVIAQSAVVNAKLWATTLSIAGKVTGDLVASERIELLATARAKCTISTPRLVLMEGAQFEGDCKMPQQGAPAHTEPRLAAAGASRDTPA